MLAVVLVPGWRGRTLASDSVGWGGAWGSAPFLKFHGEFRSEPGLGVAVRFPLLLCANGSGMRGNERILENDDF